MVKIIKKTEDEPQFSITYKIKALGPNITGSGDFTIILNYGQIYRFRGFEQGETDSPEEPTPEAIAAFLEDWANNVGLTEMAQDLELIAYEVTEIDVERA